jgi:hypothetical protein
VLCGLVVHFGPGKMPPGRPGAVAVEYVFDFIELTF